MQSTKLTKSQKRKQRLLKQGVALVKNPNTALAVVPRTSAVKAVVVAPKRRVRRRRNRGPKAGSIGTGSALSYDKALMFPEAAEGAKVPDMVAYPTGTFQLIDYRDLALGAGGDSVGFSFYPIIGDGSAAYPFGTYNGISAGNLTTRTNGSWAERSAITNLYSLFRPVSAVCTAFWMAAEGSTCGELAGGCTWASSVAAPFGTTYFGITNLPDTEVTEMADGIRVVWKPLDNSHLTFQGVTGPAGTGGAPAYPQIVIGASGITSPTSGNVLHITTIVNFEAIPDSSAGNLVQTEPSPYNPISLRKAWAWAQSNTGTVMKMVEYGAQFARVMGYNPGFDSLSMRSTRRLRNSTAALTMMAYSSKSEVPFEGKEEDDDRDVAEAIQKFEKLNANELEQKSSSELPNKTIAINRITPISSPSLVRRFGGQV